MPELPDVEIYKRRLDASALHRRISSITVADSRMLKGTSARKLRERLKGRSLNSTRRHGKYLFAALDRKSGWIVFHFGMTGDLDCVEAGGRDHYARVLFDFTNGCRLLYRSRRRLGGVWLVDDAETFIREKRLGPDALSVGSGDFERTLEKGRGAIKSLLMNQRAIAGIGNVYSDEILFQGRVHPASRADRLDAGAIERLYRSMRHVLLTAVEKQADPALFPASWLIPRRREGADCPRCGTKIGKMKIAGRSAYFCPQCQKKYSPP